MPKFETDLPSVCGHVGDRIVQYGDRRNDGRLNSICSSCLSKGTYYVQEIELSGVDLILDGGRTVEIPLEPKLGVE